MYMYVLYSHWEYCIHVYAILIINTNMYMFGTGHHTYMYTMLKVMWMCKAKCWPKEKYSIAYTQKLVYAPEEAFSLVQQSVTLQTEQ